MMKKPHLNIKLRSIIVLLFAVFLLPLPDAYCHPPVATMTYEGLGRWAIERDGKRYPVGLFFGRGIIEAFPENTGRAHALVKEVVRKKTKADRLIFGGMVAMVAGVTLSNQNPSDSDTIGTGEVLLIAGFVPVIAGSFLSDSALKDLFKVVDVCNEDSSVSGLNDQWHWGLALKDNKPSVLITKRF